MKCIKLLTFFLILVVIFPLSYALQLPSGIEKMFFDQQQLALGITFFAAFLAGLITFTSPCGFAILPTYFAVIFKERKRSMGMSLIFSLGLTSSFVGMGIIAGIIGDFFNPYKNQLAFLSGFLLVFFGILLFLNKSLAVFNFRSNHHDNHSFLSMFSVGFFLALGWTPCIGAILGGVLLLAATSGTIIKSITLLLTYSLGITLPLVLFAYYADKYDITYYLHGRPLQFSLFGKVITTHIYNIAGGIILVFIGIIMLLFKGTTFFQLYLPEYTPWSMMFWGKSNQILLHDPFFLSRISDIIGVSILVLSLLFGVKYVIKTIKEQI